MSGGRWWCSHHLVLGRYLATHLVITMILMSIVGGLTVHLVFEGAPPYRSALLQSYFQRVGLCPYIWWVVTPCSGVGFFRPVGRRRAAARRDSAA